MARGEIERTVRQSVLDRLIDNDPRSALDPPTTFAQSVRQLKASVRRDLEWLLNTRRTPNDAPEQLSDVRHSLYGYGLPDITSMGRDSTGEHDRLRRQIAEAVTAFEPRLADVRVSMVEQADDKRRQLRFLIEGLLRMEPNPEHVVFDTILEISSGEYQVRADGSA